MGIKSNIYCIRRFSYLLQPFQCTEKAYAVYITFRSLFIGKIWGACRGKKEDNSI